MLKQHWLKRDKIQLEKLKFENKKLENYFKDKNRQFLCDSKLTNYNNKVYHDWIKNEIKRLEGKIYNAKMNGYRLRYYQPECIEEKIGRLMTIQGVK